MSRNKNHLVFVGGFGGGKRLVEKTAHQLGEYLNVNDVESYTSSRARNNPERLRRSLGNASLAGSHSQGALVLAKSHRGTPMEYMVFNAPKPSSRSKLALNGLRIAAQMQLETVRRPELIIPTAKYGTGYVAELLSHFSANLIPLLSGELTTFDSRAIFDEISDSGSKATSIETTKDYFFPSLEDTPGSTMTDSGVHVITVEGNHNRLLVDTVPMLNEVFYHVYNPPR